MKTPASLELKCCHLVVSAASVEGLRAQVFLHAKERHPEALRHLAAERIGVLNQKVRLFFASLQRTL